MSESIFTYGAPGLKFGEGASDEIGHDLSQYDVRRVLVLCAAASLLVYAALMFAGAAREARAGMRRRVEGLA